MGAYDDQLTLDLGDEPEGLTAYDRPRDLRSVRAQVLITVKAAPNPSATYGDTVCVAGNRIDLEPCRWIRLCPIASRRSDVTFKKHDVIDLNMAPAKRDTRAESCTPDLSSITTVRHIAPSDGWDNRFRCLRPLDTGVTTCGLSRRWRGGQTAASLAIAEPTRVTSITVEDHPGWTDAQLQAVEAADRQGDLLDSRSRRRVAPLEAPPFQVRIACCCRESACPGHHAQMLDGEATALARRLRAEGLDVAREKVRHKYAEDGLAARKAPRLFIGDMASGPGSFSVLGAYPTRP